MIGLYTRARHTLADGVTPAQDLEGVVGAVAHSPSEGWVVLVVRNDGTLLKTPADNLLVSDGHQIDDVTHHRRRVPTYIKTGLPFTSAWVPTPELPVDGATAARFEGCVDAPLKTSPQADDITRLCEYLVREFHEDVDVKAVVTIATGLLDQFRAELIKVGEERDAALGKVDALAAELEAARGRKRK